MAGENHFMSLELIQQRVSYQTIRHLNPLPPRINCSTCSLHKIIKQVVNLALNSWCNQLIKSLGVLIHIDANEIIFTCTHHPPFECEILCCNFYIFPHAVNLGSVESQTFKHQLSVRPCAYCRIGRGTGGLYMHAMPWLAMELCVGMFVYLISVYFVYLISVYFVRMHSHYIVY